MSLSIGQILKDRYRIDGLLGQGGFGAVYLAYDLNLDGRVAIKESLDPALQTGATFRREASMLFKLEHPNLPTVLDWFSVPGEGQYLVMRYIAGQDLGTLIEARNGGLPETQVLEWIRQVCDALIYLHSQNPPIIHRDIKPANIRITPAGKAVLVDFGIAKPYDPGSRTTVVARAGTPGYTPPEQYKQSGTDVRSDVYALGATLYKLLTGVTPPDSLDVSIGEATVTPVSEINSGISENISEAVARAIQVNRSKRFANMQQFKSALCGEIPAPAGLDNVARVPVTDQVDGRQSAPVLKDEATLPRRDEPIVEQAEAVSHPERHSPGEWQSRQASELEIKPPATPGLPIIWEKPARQEDQASEAAVVETGAAAGEPATAEQPERKPARFYIWLFLLFTIGLILVWVFLINNLINPPTITIYETVEITSPPVPTATNPASIVDGKNVAMALIPEGEFLMGTDQGAGDETPVHAVMVNYFYLDIYEVSNRLYKDCVEAGVCQAPFDISSALQADYYENFAFDHFPVIHVTWEQAYQYCAWRGGRLPTEAEWEYAARGGLTGMPYPYGAAMDCSMANFHDVEYCQGDTVAVDSYRPNWYGLYNMAGNVAEWVSSLYFSYPFDRFDGREDSATFGDRVIRGGSWSDDIFVNTVTYRMSAAQDFEMDYTGFRCARTP